MTKPTNRRRKPTLIDGFLGRLTEEGRDEFYAFVSVERTLSDIQRWCAERGFSVSLTVVSCWRQRHYQAGKRAKEIAAFVKEVRGVQPMQLLEFAVAESAFLVREMRSRLDEEYSTNDVLLLLKAIKELRSSAEVLNEASVRGDRTQDILSGAYEICRKTLTAAKDQPNEQWLAELLNGELKSLEEELKKERISDA